MDVAPQKTATLDSSSELLRHSCILCEKPFLANDVVTLFERMSRVAGVGAAVVPQNWPVHQKCAEKNQAAETKRADVPEPPKTKPAKVEPDEEDEESEDDVDNNGQIPLFVPKSAQPTFDDFVEKAGEPTTNALASDENPPAKPASLAEMLKAQNERERKPVYTPLGPRTNGKCDYCQSSRAHKKDCPIRQKRETP